MEIYHEKTFASFNGINVFYAVFWRYTAYGYGRNYHAIKQYKSQTR